MKKLFTFFAAVALLCAVGCGGDEYDDSALRKDLTDLANRVAKLEQLCQQMNTNISSLQTIVNALQQNDYVTSVAPITHGGKVIGYTITFSRSGAITIYHGEDGKDGTNGANGKDGYTPQVGVMKDTDGIYYWMVDGEWLLDAKGNKIKAVGTDGKDGKDGITPQLKIENDYWFVSYDNGRTWTQLGKATGEDGDSFFSEVKEDEENVYLIFADHTSITLPKSSNALFQHIKSMTYIPTSESGNALVFYTAKENSQFELKFDVLPAKSLDKALENWQKAIHVRACKIDSADEPLDMRILSCESELESGVLTLTISGSNLDDAFFIGEQTIFVSATICDAENAIASDYIKLELALPKLNEIWYTTVDGSLISLDADIFDAAIVSHSYENGLGRIVFDNNLTAIPSDAFRQMNLSSIILPSAIATIGSYAFYGCAHLTNVVLPSNLQKIRSFVFYWCKSLEEITLPSTITSIDAYAFDGCTGSLTVYCDIPDGDAMVGVFYGAKFTTIEIKEGVSHLGAYAFVGCDMIQSITIPSTIVSYGRTPLQGCSGRAIVNCNIPNATTSFESMFEDSHFTSITIGENVSRIGSNAFSGFYTSFDLYCMPENPPTLASNSLSSSIKSIYVKSSFVGTYQKASYWNQYKSKVKAYEF